MIPVCLIFVPLRSPDKNYLCKLLECWEEDLANLSAYLSATQSSSGSIKLSSCWNLACIQTSGPGNLQLYVVLFASRCIPFQDLTAS